MDENEYRSTYHELNKRRCLFEKALNSRVCNCEKSNRFNLADREGVTCMSPSGQALCENLIQQLRFNARFALRLTSIEGPLPHASEIKIQNGGLLGLQSVVLKQPLSQQKVVNVYHVVKEAISQYGGLDELPFSDIVKAMVSYEGRRRRSRR